MLKEKCVFLDRDGVLNEERGDYTYLPDDFRIIPGVPEALELLKANKFRLVVVTNQGGMAKGLFTKKEMQACHEKLMAACPGCLDAIYYAPAHPSVSASLARKPDSLMLEKAIARFNLDVAQSWLVGDQPRDLAAARKVGVKAIWINSSSEPTPDGILRAPDLLAATALILGA